MALPDSSWTFKSIVAFFAVLFLLHAQPREATSAGAPAQLADDPIAKALGPAVMSAALKEGRVHWYAGDNTGEFFKGGGKAAFEKRFGIKVEPLVGRLREHTDRLRAEQAAGRVNADVFDGVDQYLMELHRYGALEKFTPPITTLDGYNKAVFTKDPVGFWTPLFISAQALIVNTNMVKKDEYPKSYLDIVNPKWKGRWPRAIHEAREAVAGSSCRSKSPQDGHRIYSQAERSCRSLYRSRWQSRNARCGIARAISARLQRPAGILDRCSERLAVGLYRSPRRGHLAAPLHGADQERAASECGQSCADMVLRAPQSAALG